MTDRYKPPSQKVSTPVILVDPTTGEVYTAIPVAIDDAGTLATEATLTDVNANILAIRGAVKLEDAVVGAGDAGVPAMVVRDDSLAALTNADGDYTHLRVGSTGLLWTTVSGILPGTAATQLGKAEDAAHTSGDVGVYALAVRSDTAAASGANGDYVSFIVDATGKLWVTGTYLIDAVAGASDAGVLQLAVRDDTLSALTPADGDYTQLRTDSTGAQWVRVTSLDAALPAGTNLVGRVDHSSTGIGHGVTTVTTAGTDVALAGSTAAKMVTIQAQTDNTGVIAVGASGVDATVATGTGVLLAPGDSITLPIDNLADIYIDATVNGEGVRYTYTT